DRRDAHRGRDGCDAAAAVVVPRNRPGACVPRAWTARPGTSASRAPDACERTNGARRLLHAHGRRDTLASCAGPADAHRRWPYRRDYRFRRRRSAAVRTAGRTARITVKPAKPRAFAGGAQRCAALLVASTVSWILHREPRLEEHRSSARR